MDVLSDVLETLELRCTSMRPISLGNTQAGEIMPVLAYIVVAGGLKLRFQANPAGLALGPLDCILLAGAEEHELQPVSAESSAPTRALRCAYAFDRGLPHPFARYFPRRLCLRSRDLTDKSELGRAVWLLEGELINARPGFDFVALRLAEIMLVEMLRRCHLDEPQVPFLAALSDPPIHAALQQIHRQLEHPWQVRELAASVGLSRAAFAERFHRRAGEPPLRYVRHWRMLKARGELRRTAVPIKTVATHAGYESAAGFRRAFRRVFGRSPSSLR